MIYIIFSRSNLLELLKRKGEYGCLFYNDYYDDYDDSRVF